MVLDQADQCFDSPCKQYHMSWMLQQNFLPSRWVLHFSFELYWTEEFWFFPFSYSVYKLRGNCPKGYKIIFNNWVVQKVPISHSSLNRGISKSCFLSYLLFLSIVLLTVLKNFYNRTSRNGVKRLMSDFLLPGCKKAYQGGKGHSSVNFFQELKIGNCKSNIRILFIAISACYRCSFKSYSLCHIPLCFFKLIKR